MQMVYTFLKSELTCISMCSIIHSRMHMQHRNIQETCDIVGDCIYLSDNYTGNYYVDVPIEG